MAEQRSKPYPAIPVSEAVARVKELYKKLGDGKSYNRDNFAQGLGYKDSKNGAFLRVVAGLTQYGLVYKDGNDYKITDLSRKFLIPTKETAEAEATKEAVLIPSLFSQLYDRYNGQELPTLLPNILVTDFGILDGVKNKAAAVFRQSMEYVGLLKGNVLGESADDVSESVYDENIQSYSPATRTYVPEHEDIPTVPTTALVKDFGNGRVARLAIPSDLSEQEREKLANLVKSM